jgi:DNA replication protein DnaC
MRGKDTRVYLRVAWALWIVTLSSVASRLGRPRSKYLTSNSTKGNISCGKSKQKGYRYLKKKKKKKERRRRRRKRHDWWVRKGERKTFSLIDFQMTRVISSPA